MDLGGLNAITVGRDGTDSTDSWARIGAGARLAGVYEALHRQGRTIPGGCGPTVGIAGLTLGGGLGLLGRTHGLTCDSLVGARVVLADGREVDCDADREPDLFWALRGAGGGQFGVVTSLVFRTSPEPRVTSFELAWPAAAAVAVVAAWQDWAPSAPDDLTANLTVVAEPGRPLRVLAFGASLRDPQSTARLVDDLADAAGARPTRTAFDFVAFCDLKRSLAASDLRLASGRPTASRSEFFADALPSAAIDRLLDALADEPRGRRELNFTAMGGAYNRVPSDATAFVHRSERYLLEHATDESKHWLDGSWAIAHAYGSGRVYPNFPDEALTDWASAYHGSNLDRLRAARRRYDPDRFFHFPQAV